MIRVTARTVPLAFGVWARGQVDVHDGKPENDAAKRHSVQASNQ